MSIELVSENVFLDLDVSTRVQLVFARTGIRGIYVDVSDAVVTLRGHVALYYEKQLAQELARRVVGVQRVVNDIDVRADLPVNADLEPELTAWPIPVPA